ncbi:type I pullulanase [Alkalibacter saccharofermentans]|uniref:Pullulanase n=1 Tax=Alkalibacter saccharofermentans DSM 14828 TaxID=1120975 RepID=A0A1M4S9S4_9FIRM|nr:type I pullulanase [Alkalibacter saccharofermentans]SHE28939.1 pullulanase [Alkalibacter saccharofermentans DSM 14828]
MKQYEYSYSEKKLGYSLEGEDIIFRVWAPGRETVTLALYDDPLDIRRTLHYMIPDEDKVFEITLAKDEVTPYYTYILDHEFEVTDPYSTAVSLNSLRSAIVDMENLKPPGWEEHKLPGAIAETDAIIYEMHIKDFTGHKNSGAINKGKYLGVIEPGTTHLGFATGLDHLKELGITHVHLMPVYDFLTVDENPDRFNDDSNYNWGYDPEHYNVPEGSYSTDPSDPGCRIYELRQMIQKLHEEGFKVIVDVVYNHTYRGRNSNFNLLAPEYYYRTRTDGSYSDGSGCGNELATERPMVRKFILDSLMYWVNEFKIDGFRFDLMALIDIETVRKAVNILRLANESIFIYGEPWTAGMTTLSDKLTTTKGKQQGLSFAFLNDNFRNAIKGDSNGEGRGFVHGNCDMKRETEIGLAGSIFYDKGRIGFGIAPNETINYINSHDNLIIYDKMKKIFSQSDESFIVRLNKLAFGILFVSQGIPFIHSGNEFLRSKNMLDNTYNSSFNVNALNWSLKSRNNGFYNFFKDLIQLRKKHPEFRLKTGDKIRESLKFFDVEREGCNCIGYTIKLDNKNVEEGKYTLVAINGHHESCLITLSMVRNHIEKQYGLTEDHLCIIEILNMDGLVTSKNSRGELDPHGVEIPGYSIMVFSLAERCVK